MCIEVSKGECQSVTSLPHLSQTLLFRPRPVRQRDQDLATVLTRDGPETINGDKCWAKIASGTGKGNWVAMAFGKYIIWSGKCKFVFVE